MNGPDHYREAERLLGTIEARKLGSNETFAAAEMAQVHATLALTAATLAAAEHTAESAYNVAGGARPGQLVSRPHPGDEVDPPYPGNPWGRALYGEATR